MDRYHPEGHYPTDFLGPSSGDYWVFDSIDADWLLAQRVTDQDGELVIAELRVIAMPHTEREWWWVQHSLEKPEEDGFGAEPRAAAGGLAARRVRPAIRTGAAIERARSAERRDRRSAFPSSFRFSDQALEAPPRVGSRGRSDRYYAEFAAAYVAAIDRGERAPVEAVANELGDGHSRTYVRDTLNIARDRGLLTRPARGRSGGQLTDEARAVLAKKPGGGQKSSSS